MLNISYDTHRKSYTHTSQSSSSKKVRYVGDSVIPLKYLVAPQEEHNSAIEIIKNKIDRPLHYL